VRAGLHALARTLDVVAIRRFPFAFEPRYRRILWLMSVTPARSGVEIVDGTLRVRFGPWRVQTDVGNIRCAEETGPYQALRAIGPHISMADQGLSFGSTARGGVCLLFHDPVPGRETLGLIKHPGLTVTVVDPVGLIDAIADAQRSSDSG
jgi:hypothetical protein